MNLARENQTGQVECLAIGEKKFESDGRAPASITHKLGLRTVDIN